MFLNVVLIAALALPAPPTARAIQLLSRSDAGMFAVLGDVLAVLDCYESAHCSAIKIDFGTGGLYYDAAKGPNWYSYYFEPLELGAPAKGQNYLKTDKPSWQGLRWLERDEPDRNKLNHLITKYIKIRSYIQKQVDQFVTKNFDKHFVIGVHYRGTDKISEAPRIRYNDIIDTIKLYGPRNGDFRIFVASDEENFVSFMKESYGNRVTALNFVARSKSGKPIHLSNQSNHYENGLHALLDCLLLSKTDLLIRTSSNLSRWSTYFNPDLEVIELSQRH